MIVAGITSFLQTRTLIWLLAVAGFPLPWLQGNLHASGQQPGAITSMEKVTIPFQYVNGFIVLQLTFQNTFPLKFILDTGAENSILFKKEYADVFGIEYVKTIRLVGSDLKREMKALVSQGISLQLQGLPPSRQNLIVLEEDFVLVEEVVGMKIDGLIGCSFFAGKALKIDYKRQELTVLTAKALKKERLKGYTIFPLEMIQRKPYLHAEVAIQNENRIPVRLLLDTGAALSCLIHSNTDPALQPVGKLLPGKLGKGLGGEIEGFTGIVRALHIGSFVYDNVLSSFQNLDSVTLASNRVVRNGLLGNLLLERSTLVIDWTGSRLFYKPEKKFNRPFDFDKSGLTLFAFGPELNRFSVRHVVPGSPADEAGLQPGDEIIKVGCWSARWLTLARMNKKLSGKAGRKLQVQWLRDKQAGEATVELRDLFEEKKPASGAVRK